MKQPKFSLRRFEMEVYYDSWCPMCRSVRKNISRFDHFRLIHFSTFRDKKIAIRLPIPLENLEEEMYAKIVRNQKYVSGVHAFAAMTLRTPLLSPFSVFLKLCILLGIGSKVYKFIASKRNIIPTGGCSKHGCKL